MAHLYDLNPHLRPKPKAVEQKVVEEKPKPPVKKGRPKKADKE